MELLVVVVILGLLGAFVAPAYQNYLKQGRRESVQSQMTLISQNLAAYKLANGNYGSTNSNSGYKANPLSNPVIYGSTQYPKTGTADYTLTITAAPSTTWVLTATPTTTGKQKTDGIVVLNSDGQRCWVKASSTACVPTATSNWDGK